MDPKVGTGKKPKGSGRRLYTDENPKDTVRVKFKTVQDVKDTLSKTSFKSKPHARKSQIINLIHQRVRAAYGKAKDPEVKKRLKRVLDYAEKRKEASKRKTQQLREYIREQIINEIGEASARPYLLKRAGSDGDAKFKNRVYTEFIFTLDDIEKNPLGIIQLTWQLSTSGEGVLEVSFDIMDGGNIAFDTTNYGIKTLFRVMSTVVDAIKSFREQELKDVPLTVIRFSTSPEKSSGKIAKGGEIRANLYTNYISKYFDIIEKDINPSGDSVFKVKDKNTLEEGVIKNLALATMLAILPAGAVKGQTIDKEKITTVQQIDTEDPYYPWTPKNEQKQRFDRAKKLYEPLSSKINKISNSNELTSIGKFNKTALENLKNGTLMSSPTDNEFPEFHFRNPPPLDPTLKEIQEKIINLPEDKLAKLLNIDFRKATPKMAYDIVKITGFSIGDILRYIKAIKGLKGKGYTA